MGTGKNKHHAVSPYYWGLTLWLKNIQTKTRTFIKRPGFCLDGLYFFKKGDVGDSGRKYFL